MNLLALKVTPFVRVGGTVRHVVTYRDTGKAPIAVSLYESHLEQKCGSPNTRDRELRHLAHLYSWGLTTGLDLDCLLFAGEGLSLPLIRAFTAWLRERSLSKSRQLTDASKKSINSILYGCECACVWFIEHYAKPSGRLRRAVEVEMLVASQKRAWKSATLKVPRTGIAPDLSDVEIAAIEQYLRPETRGKSIGPVLATRDYLIWRLSIELSLRIGEILAARTTDCPTRDCPYFRVVRIEERGPDYRDPRGIHAPRPKTLSRDLGFILQNTAFPRLISEYISECRFRVETRFGKQIPQFILPHSFLIIAENGNPLSIRAADDIAAAISRNTGIDFYWHLSRHAFFNRAYGAVAEIEDAAQREIRLNDLIYWGGWRSAKSLDIYTQRARRDRARTPLRLWQEKGNLWKALG